MKTAYKGHDGTFKGNSSYGELVANDSIIIARLVMIYLLSEPPRSSRMSTMKVVFPSSCWFARTANAPVSGGIVRE